MRESFPVFLSPLAKELGLFCSLNVACHLSATHPGVSSRACRGISALLTAEERFLLVRVMASSHRYGV